MGFKGKLGFFRTGMMALWIGVMIVIIGSFAMREFQLSSIYPSDLYWHISLNIVGSGLILTGLIIMIVGSLRTD